MTAANQRTRLREGLTWPAPPPSRPARPSRSHGRPRRRQPGVDREADGAGRGFTRGRVIVVGDRRVSTKAPRPQTSRPRCARSAPTTRRRTATSRSLSTSAISTPKTVERAVPAVEGGRFALANYSHALKMAARGEADAVCFTPFNKQAMRLAHRPMTTRSAIPRASSASPGRRASSTCWTSSGTRASPRMCRSRRSLR
jgi:hypothetical protein